MTDAAGVQDRMTLDVIVPTYNRVSSLARTLDSLFRAIPPPQLAVSVLVVDNNSNDGTRDLVHGLQPRVPRSLKYCFERRQGRSWALNTGIRSTTGTLIGLVDDDEEVDSAWYEAVYGAFLDQSVDFVGGPYVPRWSQAPPHWIPKNYPGVLGIIDAGSAVLRYDTRFPGILMGGNAVLRRTILQKVGLYATDLGRSGTRLTAGEDADMYERLIRAGARGFYMPSLVIYHHIPPERMTKRYFRRWCFWRGASEGLRYRRNPDVRHVFGIPRYLVWSACRGTAAIAGDIFVRSRPADRQFANELAIWDLFGFVCGRCRRVVSPARSRRVPAD